MLSITLAAILVIEGIISGYSPVSNTVMLTQCLISQLLLIGLTTLMSVVERMLYN